MLALIEKDKNIDFCVVHKIDRLARRRADDVFLDIAIRKANCRLISVTENIDETPSGQLTRGILSSINEFYLGNLAAEVSKGMLQKAKTGGTPGRAPLGYRNVPIVVDNRVIHSVAVDPERAPLIQLGFELYATGEYSIMQLCEVLNAKGLRTLAGTDKTEGPIAWQSLGKLLIKPYYAGYVSYQGVLYKGQHDAIVSQELFDRVQRVLKSRMSGEKQRVHLHYLKSSLYCMRCSSPLRITAAKSSYLYYYCSSRPKKQRCDLPYTETTHIEESLLNYFQHIQLNDSEIEQVRSAVERYMAKSHVLAVEDSKRQKTRLSALTAEQSKLMQAYYANVMPLDLFGTEQARINREIGEAEGLIAKAAVKFDALKEVFEQSLWLARHCFEAYERAPETERRQINQALFTGIYVDRAEDSGKTTVEASELAEPFGAIMALAGRGKEAAANTKKRPEGRNLGQSPLFEGQGSDDDIMVHLCLRLQNFSDKMRVQRAYQSLHGMQDPIEAKYLARWNDDPLHKPRLSPYHRKMNIKDLAADYVTGKSLRELAAKYGVDRKTVALQLRKAGVVLRLPGCNVWVGALDQ